MSNKTRQTHKIDATNQPLGRLASRIAILLRGKHKTQFTPHIDDGDFVEIENIDKLKFTGNKLKQKTYYRHSTYPGGLKSEKLNERINRKGYEDVLRHAVRGMLPDNKLRKQMMKRLIIK